MIYLDHAATTKMRAEVASAMQPFLIEQYGNPSSLHALGRKARSALDRARLVVADFLHCDASEVIFTAGGTEAANAALVGAFFASEKRKHIVVSGIEHHAVLDTCEFLKTLGAEVTVVMPRGDGVVTAEAIMQNVREDTLLVSLMHVNNETGAIQPVDEVTRAVHALDADICVHSDMVQSLGTEPIHLHDLQVDFASFSAHKIGGPKGVGALFVRKGSQWTPFLHGGAQERNRRAGTENVAGIVGFAAAVTYLKDHWHEHVTTIAQLRSDFLRPLQQVEGIFLNSFAKSVPGILNMRVSGITNETLLMRLDMEGIAASAGSACTAGSLEPSHVLLASGMSPESVRESIRFSLGDDLTSAEVIRAAEVFSEVVEQLRNKPR